MAGCQEVVANCHHKNKGKLKPHESFQVPKDRELD